MLLGAIQSVVVDPGFQVPSVLAATSRETAALLSACSKATAFEVFATRLITNLKSCFVSHRTLKLQIEAMWGSYHLLRTTSSFQEDWISFVQTAVQRTPSPTFFQHVAHEVFKALIKLHYSLNVQESEGAVGKRRRECDKI